MVIVGSILLTAGALAAVRYLGISHLNAAAGARSDAMTRSAASGDDHTIGAGRTTPAPTSTGARHVPGKAPSPGVSHAPSPAPSRSQAAAPVPAGTATKCTKPKFVTSAPTGGWSDGSYYLYNDMWNISGYTVTQTLYACAYNNWYVVANMNNDSGNGAVKTYPDVQANFNEPAISSFHAISSTFAETSPHVGIYEDAYDIWINGVATSGSTEVMVWTENFHQVPAGSVQGSVTFGGRRYTVWKNGSYIAVVANTNFTSGTVNLLQIFDWIMAKGWMPATSTLGQIDYGAEIVSTNSAPATFTFTNFSVSTS